MTLLSPHYVILTVPRPVTDTLHLTEDQSLVININKDRLSPLLHRPGSPHGNSSARHIERRLITICLQYPGGHPPGERPAQGSSGGAAGGARA